MHGFIEHNAESMSRFWLSPYARIRKEESGFCIQQTLFGRSVLLNWPEERLKAFLSLLSGGAEEAEIMCMLANFGSEGLLEQLMRDGILE